MICVVTEYMCAYLYTHVGELGIALMGVLKRLTNQTIKTTLYWVDIKSTQGP